MHPVAWQMKFIIYSTIVRVQVSLPLFRKPRQGFLTSQGLAG